VAVCQTYAHNLVAFKYVDCNHTVGTRAAVCLKACLLYDAVLCCKYHIVAVYKLLIVKTAQTKERVNAVIALDIEQVLYCTALRVLCPFGYLIALQPVATSLLRKEHHGVVHRRRIYIFGEVLLTAVSTLAANASACLLPELRKRRALDISEVAYRYYNRIIGVEILRIELLTRILYLRAALVSILFLNLQKLVFHYLLAQFGVVEYRLQVSNLSLKLLILCMQLLHAQTCKLCKAHVDYRLRLQLVQLKPCLKVALCVGRSLRLAYDMHNFVYIVACYYQSFKYVGTLLCLAQVKLCAAYGDVMAVLNKIFHTLFKREQARTSVDKGNAIH